MPKVLIPDAFRQHLTNLGAVLNGGTITTHAGGTSTPITTWTDSTGAVAQANPIVLDSAGREQGGIWLTAGTAYKFILKDSAGVTLDTVDNIVVGEAASVTTTEYDVTCTFAGTPAAQGWMGGMEFSRAVNFVANFVGSQGSVVTNPGASFVIDVQKNGVTAGTITINTSGVYSFATAGGAAQSFAAGDTIDFYGPSSVGTAANIKFTLLGTIP